MLSMKIVQKVLDSGVYCRIDTWKIMPNRIIGIKHLQRLAVQYYICR